MSSGTKRDSKDVKYNDSKWGEIAVAAATATLGYAAFKSGLGKKGVSSFIKKASKASKASKGVGTFRAVKGWLNSERNSSSYINSLIQKGDNIISPKDFKNLTTKKKRKELYARIKENVSSIITEQRNSETIADVQKLEESIRKSTNHIDSLKDTTVMKKFAEINKVSKQIKDSADFSRDERIAIRNKMTEDLIEMLTLTDNMKKDQIKKTGHRKITIGDLFTVEKGKIENKGIARRLFTDEDINSLKSNLKSSFYTDIDGNKKSILHNKKIKDMIIDDAILYDGKDVADLRFFKNAFKDVTSSLASDFKIPIIGINPLSILGVGELSKDVTSFAVLQKGTIQSAITGSAKHLNRHMIVSNGKAFTVSKNMAGITEGTLTKIKDNVRLEKITPGMVAGPKSLDATRKMHGTNRIEYNEYTEKDGAFSNFYKKIAKALDFGFDDVDAQTMEELGANEILNPNSWIASIANKFKKTGFLRPNKGMREIVDPVEGTKRTQKTIAEMFATMDVVNKNEDLFVAVNEGFSIVDVVKSIGKAEEDNLVGDSVGAMKKYISQYFAGRDNLKDVTTNTTMAHFMFDRVSSTLGIGGFGFSSESLASPFDIFKNLMLKRVLPVYVGYNAIQFGIMLTEGEEDELGNKDNALKTVARAAAKTDLIFHKGLEMFGISAFASGMMEAMPGIDHITELPFIKSIALDQDYEERLDYITNGYEKVRKNRYWEGGNQAITGSKVDSFKPSLYRRIMADSDFSDTKFGSRFEYFSNAPFPTPLTPFAPLKHFVTDPYHYDKKHMQDRPYPVTTPMFQNIPFLGSVLAPTIGEIIKPTKYTNPHIINDTGMNIPKGGFTPSISGASLMFTDDREGADLYGDLFDMPEDGLGLAPMVSISAGGTSSLIGSYTTSRDEISKDLERGKPLNSISSSSTSSNYSASIEYSEIVGTDNQNNVSYNTRQLAEDAGNFFGLYGFITTTATGEPLDNSTYLENSSYAFSSSRMFWNTDVGGLGGDVNEIARRFLRKRMPDENLINPIKNNMADWLPGDSYFKDFKHGDPYCVSPDTLIETDNGYKKAEDVCSNDMIITHKSRYHDIKYIVKRAVKENEEVLKFTISGMSNNTPLIFSEEHPIYIKKLYKCSFGSSCICRPCVRNYNGYCDNSRCTCKWDNTPIEFIKAKNCKIGDAVVYPIPKQSTYISEIKYSIKYSYAPRSAVSVIDGSYELNTNTSWLLGLYMAEGSTGKQNGKPMRIVYSLNSNEVDVIAKVVEEFKKITSKNIITRTSSKGSSTDVIIHDAKLARIFDYIIPGNLYEKRIPKDMFMSNDDNKLAFILGFMLGDGCVSNNYLIGSSANKDLILDFHKLCFNSGIPCNYIERNTRKSYELAIHAFNLKDKDLELLLYKKHRLNLTFKRQPGITSWTDGEYIYSIIKNIEIVDDCDNVIGFEIDDDDTFCVMGFATHNTKIANGELRLPGQAYERLHNIKSFDLYSVDAGFLTSGDDFISAAMTKKAPIVDQKKAKTVLDIYRNNDRILEDGGTISDYDRNVKASYDAIVNIGDDNGMLFIDTVGTSESQKQATLRAQVAMYLAGDKKAYVHSIGKEEGTGMMTTIDYDPSAVDSAMNAKNRGMSKIEKGMENGELSNGDFYSPIDRLRILADVAPYSDEFTKMKSIVSTMDMTEEQREEVSQINERVKEMRKPLRLYDYKYLGRSTTSDIKVVASILDDKGTFTVVGDDKIYKLAGINIKSHDNEILNDDMKEVMDKYLSVGKTVKLEFDANPALRFKGGANRVIVKSLTGKSLQDELLTRNLAQEGTGDTPIDTKVKTNAIQRAIGVMWESISHADTPVHSKFLRVRSAKEDYERTRVYGMQFARWQNPISDYLIPFVFNRNVARSPVSGIAMGALVGSMFGRNAFGRAVGALTVAGTIAAGKVVTGIKEEVTNETWKPKRVVKEQNLYDYMDKLKYVKYRKLYHDYSAKAKKKDGIKTKEIIRKERKMKTEKRVKQGWMQDYKVRQSKLHQIFKVPNFLLRLSPRADLNVDGFLKDEMYYQYANFNRKMKRSKKDIIKHIKDSGNKSIDRSNAKTAPKSLKEILKTTWDKDLLKEESEKRQQDFIRNKLNRIKNKKAIIPLRGNLRYDREAPPSEKLDKLIQAKVELTNFSTSGGTDDDIREALSNTKVIPVYKGQLAGRRVNREKTMLRLNEEINKMTKKAGFSLDGAKAMEYYKMSEATMYAYDRGDSISGVASAMEKKDRDYFREFVNAKDDEKLEILDLIPKYMRRPLEAAWGLDVEDKDNLTQYFSKHALPDSNWEGWSEDVDLNAVKVRMAKNEKIEFSDVNIWADDVKMANMSKLENVPIMNSKTSVPETRSKLYKVMGKMGYSDVAYSSNMNGTSSKDINLYLKYDKRAEYKEQINGQFAGNI